MPSRLAFAAGMSKRFEVLKLFLVADESPPPTRRWPGGWPFRRSGAREEALLKFSDCAAYQCRKGRKKTARRCRRAVRRRRRQSRKRRRKASWTIERNR